ncbi:nickel pincer cofactor biosynthesis protein LarC [Desulforudis sp. 1088]|uniref:nickel pincer cofactor biosynthesis protein LarC n=2 Tax=Candidatus Desulforudis TaxID=471826 RepID=UPI003CE44ACE
MKVLFWDCSSGIAGDMALASLIDAGADAGRIEAALGTLGIDPFQFRVAPVKSYGIKATKVRVDAPDKQPHRRLTDILRIISEASLAPQVKTSAQKVFARLAEAEARVHGISPSEVHFHEVGAVDAIVEVVGTCLALDFLGVEQIAVSPFPLGHGFVRCRHGLLPVPAPATLELLRGFPVRPANVEGETVTPTGAALATALAAATGPIPPMTVDAVGYGAGTADFGFPNILRAILGWTATPEPEATEPVAVLETNLDDVNPEILPEVIRKLLDEGARDAFITPVIMKKGRPGTKLTVLAHEHDRQRLAGLLIAETGTLGVRMRHEERIVVPRQTFEIRTRYGPVRVKLSRMGREVVRIKPEYEDCRTRAAEAGVTTRAVYDEAVTVAYNELAQLLKDC